MRCWRPSVRVPLRSERFSVSPSHLVSFHLLDLTLCQLTIHKRHSSHCCPSAAGLEIDEVVCPQAFKRLTIPPPPPLHQLVNDTTPPADSQCSRPSPSPLNNASKPASSQSALSPKHVSRIPIQRSDPYLPLARWDKSPGSHPSPLGL